MVRGDIKNDSTIDKAMRQCFQLEREYKEFIKFQGSSIKNVIYDGKLYGAPDNIRNMFEGKLIEHIKRNVHQQTDYIIIHK